MSYNNNSNTCWIVTDGTVGMLKQSIAVANSLDLLYDILEAHPTPILRLFPKLAKIPTWRLTIGRTPSWIRGPYPDYIISCGRRMSGLSIGLRRLSKGKSQTIHIQDPCISPKNFDVLVVPSHDKLATAKHKYSNLVISTGSLSWLVKDEIMESKSKMIDRFSPIDKPQIILLLGGNNRRYRVTKKILTRLFMDVYKYANTRNARLIIIPSSRTPKRAKSIFEQLDKEQKHIFWDGKNGNPYPEVFSIANEIIVTSDSVNMVTEACLFGLPVFIAHWQEEKGRIANFHKIMNSSGYTQYLQEANENLKPKILNQMPKIAMRISKILRKATN